MWCQAKNARRWPGIATPTLMARVAGGCLVFGGAVVTLLVASSPSNFRAVGTVYAIALFAAVTGVAALLVGPRLRSWQFQLLVVVATAMITATVHLASTAAFAVSLATLYAFVAFAAFFLSWPQSIAHLGLAVVCCIVVLGCAPTVPYWSGLIAATTTIVMGVIIASLGQLMSDSERDLATGLPNRQGFDRILGHVIAAAQLGGAHPAVVLLFLEGLEETSDRFGQHAGDQLVRSTVDRWAGVLRPEYVLARLGDDEFGVLLPGGTEHEGVALSHRIRVVTPTGCAAGVTAWQPDETAAVVLSRADVALRQAKRGGRNRTVVESAGTPTLASELADAIAHNRVDVLYQPIVSLSAGNAIVGVEALARWTPPSRPDLTISEVITVAEHSNLIATLDRFVLRRACVDVGWMQRHRSGPPLTLTVNVSGLELIEKGYAATVTEILDETGWPAEQLVVEVTESVVDVDTPASVAALSELRGYGIRVAIDDFGTGYSTLSRLQTLPIDLLKLDASFTARTALDPSSPPPPMLQAIAALARALDLPVVIEGVETESQATALQRAGFAMAQGYFFGRPQERERLVDRLTVG
jgi:diguanylate cyclase (GGDEF)-like protein